VGIGSKLQREVEMVLEEVNRHNCRLSMFVGATIEEVEWLGLFTFQENEK